MIREAAAEVQVVGTVVVETPLKGVHVLKEGYQAVSYLGPL